MLVPAGATTAYISIGKAPEVEAALFDADAASGSGCALASFVHEYTVPPATSGPLVQVGAGNIIVVRAGAVSGMAASRDDSPAALWRCEVVHDMQLFPLLG
jgi:hypothetical protein